MKMLVPASLLSRLRVLGALAAGLAVAGCSIHPIDAVTTGGTSGEFSTTGGDTLTCDPSQAFIEIVGLGAPEKFTGGCAPDEVGPSGWKALHLEGTDVLAIRACDTKSDAWISLGINEGMAGPIGGQVDYKLASGGEYIALDAATLDFTTLEEAGGVMAGSYTALLAEDGPTISGDFVVCRLPDNPAP
jgi:hypothetical protein